MSRCNWAATWLCLLWYWSAASDWHPDIIIILLLLLLLLLYRMYLLHSILGWHHHSMGWHYLLSLWLAGWRVWLWLCNHFFLVWDRLITITVCLTWPVSHIQKVYNNTAKANSTMLIRCAKNKISALQTSCYQHIIKIKVYLSISIFKRYGTLLCGICYNNTDVVIHCIGTVYIIMARFR